VLVLAFCADAQRKKTRAHRPIQSQEPVNGPAPGRV
jgi:hypothetical protein